MIINLLLLGSGSDMLAPAKPLLPLDNTAGKKTWASPRCFPCTSETSDGHTQFRDRLTRWSAGIQRATVFSSETDGGHTQFQDRLTSRSAAMRIFPACRCKA